MTQAPLKNQYTSMSKCGMGLSTVVFLGKPFDPNLTQGSSVFLYVDPLDSSTAPDIQNDPVAYYGHLKGHMQKYINHIYQVIIPTLDKCNSTDYFGNGPGKYICGLVLDPSISGYEVADDMTPHVGNGIFFFDLEDANGKRVIEANEFTLQDMLDRWQAKIDEIPEQQKKFQVSMAKERARIEEARRSDPNPDLSEYYKPIP